MELFQQLVLGIAIMLLIAAYIMIYFTHLDNDSTWPPSVAKCPNGWNYNSTNDNCTFGAEIYPTNNEKLTSVTSCDKYNWATDKNISWDGLTYGVSMNC